MQHFGALCPAAHLQKPRHSSLLRFDTASALPHRFSVPAGSVSSVMKTMATVSHTRSEQLASKASSREARMSSSLLKLNESAVAVVQIDAFVGGGRRA